MPGLTDFLESSGANKLAADTPGGYWGLGGAAAGGVADIGSLILNIQNMMEKARINRILTDPKAFAQYTGKASAGAAGAVSQQAGANAAVSGASGGVAQNMINRALLENYFRFAGLTSENLRGAAGGREMLPFVSPSILGALLKLKELRSGQQPGIGAAPRTLDATQGYDVPSADMPTPAQVY